MEQHQDYPDGVGLAHARPPAQHREPPERRNRRGQLLAVQPRWRGPSFLLVGLEHQADTLPQQLWIGRGEQGRGGPLIQQLGQPALVAPIAIQVEQVAVQDEGGGAVPLISAPYEGGAPGQGADQSRLILGPLKVRRLPVLLVKILAAQGEQAVIQCRKVGAHMSMPRRAHSQGEGEEQVGIQFVGEHAQPGHYMQVDRGQDPRLEKGRQSLLGVLAPRSRLLPWGQGHKEGGHGPGGVSGHDSSPSASMGGGSRKSWSRATTTSSAGRSKKTPWYRLCPPLPSTHGVSWPTMPRIKR